MHRKQMWVYHCDFCRKRSCSASHMSRHEKACTGNPCRICRMCGKDRSLRELLVAVNADIDATDPDSIGWRMVDDVKQLEMACECCPACMLYAARMAEYIHGDSVSISVEFDRRKRAWWK